MSEYPQFESAESEEPSGEKSSQLRILLPILLVLIGYWLFKNLGSTEYDEFVGQQFEYSGVSFTGEAIDQHALQGSVVVVNYWATYCPYCLEDIEHLKELQSQLRYDEFKIVGVSSDSRDVLNDFFLSRDPLPWPTLYGGDAVNLGKTYKVTTIPRVMLLNRDGQIVAVARAIEDIKDQVLDLVYDG